MVQPFDKNELEKLIKGCQKKSEVIEKIKEAVKNPKNYFYNRSWESVRNGLRTRGMLEGLKQDNQGISFSWSQEKKDQFKEDYANAKTVSVVVKKYDLESENQARNIAKTLKTKRKFMGERSSVKGKNPKKQKASTQTVNKKLLELIETGILLEEKGFDNLHEKITKEFPQNRPDKRKFKNRIYALIFARASQKQKAFNKALQDIVRMKLSDEETIKSFNTIYPFIPIEFAEKQMKWHQGLNKGRGKKLMGKSLPGIGRIDLSGGIPDFKIPRTSFNKPFAIKTKDPDNWPVMVLNGTNFGLKHAPDIVGNVARKALSDAAARKDEAIILTNFLCFDLKKAGGPAKTARAQILGDNINPELIRDADYKKVIQHIISEHPVDEIAYRTTEELVNDVLGGWIKVCTKPNNHPEYTGKIYIAIGLNELALICAITYWEIRWWTLKKQKELDNRIAILKKSLTQARKELGQAMEAARGLLDKKADEYTKVRGINEELRSLEYQRAITTVSNVATQESQRFFGYAYGKVVEKIESAIPNSKVIGEGTSYFDIGKKIIKIYVPSHIRVSDGLLSDYALGYGPSVLREKNPKAIVVCHPWALQFRATGRETDHDGQRDSMKVYVAPIAIDDKYLRSELTTLRKKDHPIMKAVYNHTFKSGVLRLRCSNGIIDAEEIPVEALESFKNYPRSRVTSKTTGTAVYNRGPKYFWTMLISDQHWGGRSKEFFWVKVNGVQVRLSLAEAVFHMMREQSLFEGNNMRVHFVASPDDPTQSQNVKYRTEPHPQEIPYHLIEKITGKAMVDAEKIGTKKAFQEAAEKIRRLCLIQFERRASDYIFEQLMQMMDRHIEPNIDFYSAVLRRAQSAKIKITGVGDIAVAEFGGYDSRNIGLLNIGTGNHFSRTTQEEMIEGPLYAQRLRDLLLGTEEWKDQKEYINKHVLAPVYGKTCIGWGIVSVDGKHQYGLEVRSAPTNMAGWGDTLKGHVKKDIQRGNYSRIWNGKLPVIKFFGDKHFFGGVSTSYAIYHMSPASVHTDAYGERGFPPNNTGVSFMGVPIDGPDSGPIIWKCLPYDVIKDFVEINPRPFDWQEYLPNPA